MGQSLTMVQMKEAGTQKGCNINANQIGRWLRRKKKKNPNYRCSLHSFLTEAFEMMLESRLTLKFS